MQSIETKTLNATATQGERVKATHAARCLSVTIPFNYGLDWKENHQDAARQLLHKLNWNGEMHGGTTRAGMAWVFVSDDSLMIKS
tara:strand:+ start:76 stop:330 length:255 start_codon:yes stop_codon:yes gene_type:complete